MNETTPELAQFVAGLARKLEIPGVAVGIWADGQETYACHGVTSIDNPLPVDRDTMYVLGSISKTFTATALMCLAADGRVDLDAPVRRYVPQLALADAAAAERITVLHLLNHTAGFATRLGAETGEGDDALAKYVAAMAESELLTAPGARASYSQMGFNLAGRVIEKVTGLTFEQAIASLLLRPAGLRHSGYAPGEVMTRRFAVGHNTAADGTLAVVSQWKDSRANNPGGGVVSSVSDLVRWARFHLGDGSTADGTRILPGEALHRMQRQTVELPGSSLGDAFGLCWFLKDAGLQFNRAVVQWALEHYLGVTERDPEPLPYDHMRAAEVTGNYENEIMRLIVADDGSGLTVECLKKPEIRAASETELPPDLPPAAVGLLPGDGCIVTAGGLQGQRGFFTRGETDAVAGIDLAGRLFTRVR